MFIKKFIEKIFSLKIYSEKDMEQYSREDETVLALAPSDPIQEAELQTFIENNLDAWTQLFIEQNEYSPTDEQIEQQKIIISYSFDETKSLEDAIVFLVESMWDDDEVPEVLYEMVKAAIAEYINGNLKMVQQEIERQQQ